MVQPSAGYNAPGFFGASFVNDQTNFISGLAIVGANRIQRLGATTFQEGRFPDSSYAGTADTIILMPRSAAPGVGGANYFPLSWGSNVGWLEEVEDGDGQNDFNADNFRLMLLRFEVAAISPGATVFGAQLQLYHTRNRNWPTPLTSPTVSRLYAAKLNRAWTEGRGTDDENGTYANYGEAVSYTHLTLPTKRIV